MRRLSTAAALATAVSAGTLLAACGSSPSSAPASSSRSNLSAKQLVGAAYKAALGASSVHLSGTVTSPQQGQRVDLVLTKSGEVSGSIDLNGTTVEIVALANNDYLRANAAFWKTRGGAPPSIADRIGTNWLKVPPDTATSLTTDLTIKAIFGDLNKNLGKLVKVPSKTIGTARALGVRSSKGGTLYVAASGPAVPLQLIGSLKQQTANLSFSQWNQAKVAPAPKGAIPISSL